jgi:hypothetical protein
MVDKYAQNLPSDRNWIDSLNWSNARAIGLGRTPDNVGQQAVNSLGVLQTMWLLNRHPGLRTRIAAVKQPTDKNLRMAGRVRSTDFCK